ncbi:hypothetical protein IG631_11330 [Alternaria alternata]|nr:hypothetical protein IG631_11330 [Alternaria alternata]
MVHFKPTSVLFAVAALITKNVVAEEAHALEVFPELKGTGPFEIAYKDPETNKVVVEHVDENGESILEKRTCESSFTPAKSIADYYIRPSEPRCGCEALEKPQWVWLLQRFLPSISATEAGYANQLEDFHKGCDCHKLGGSRTSHYNSDSDWPSASRFHGTADDHHLGDSNDDCDRCAYHRLRCSNPTTVLTQSTTLNFPSAPTLKARHVNPPSWLKGVANNLICPACTKVWPAPPAKTVSICKTTTVTRTQTRTATAARATATTTVSVTPTAKTVTAVVSMTLTLTDSTTVTPIVTETSTATTTVATTITSTTTQTLCPQQTSDVSGIQAVQPGTLKNGPSGRTAVECCLACFSDPAGCTQWWVYTAANYCVYSVPGTGLGASSPLCPNGKGNGMLYVGSPGSLPSGFGGPGQCAA